MQTSINPRGQPVAFAGLISDSYAGPDLVSSFSEETVNSIPFGTAVKQGVAPKGALLMSGGGDAIKGIVAFDFTHAPGVFGDIDAGALGIVPKGQLRILRRGRVWVVIDQGIVTIAPFSDRGFIRYSANGAGNLIVGAVSNVTDGAHNTDMSKVVIFTSTVQVAADGTKIAEVEVDFTNKP